jgi:hypothetical protein
MHVEGRRGTTKKYILWGSAWLVAASAAVLVVKWLRIR